MSKKNKLSLKRTTNNVKDRLSNTHYEISSYFQKPKAQPEKLVATEISFIVQQAHSSSSINLVELEERKNNTVRKFSSDLNTASDDFSNPPSDKPIASIFKPKYKSNIKDTKRKKGKNNLTQLTELQRKFLYDSKDFNPEHIELALALSKSENSEQLNEPSCEELNLTEQQHIQNLKKKLSEYGFRTTNLKSESVKTSSTNKQKRRRRWLNATLILRTQEDRERIVQKKVWNALEQKFIEKDNSPTKYCNNSFPIKLTGDLLERSYCYEKVIFRKTALESASDFYVNDLVTPSSVKTGYLLKDWSKIPGRDRSPSLDRYISDPLIKKSDLLLKVSDEKQLSIPNMTIQNNSESLPSSTATKESIIQSLATKSVCLDVTSSSKLINICNETSKMNNNEKADITIRTLTPDLFSDCEDDTAKTISEHFETVSSFFNSSLRKVNIANNSTNDDSLNKELVPSNTLREPIDVNYEKLDEKENTSSRNDDVLDLTQSSNEDCDNYASDDSLPKFSIYYTEKRKSCKIATNSEVIESSHIVDSNDMNTSENLVSNELNNTCEHLDLTHVGKNLNSNSFLNATSDALFKSNEKNFSFTQNFTNNHNSLRKSKSATSLETFNCSSKSNLKTNLSQNLSGSNDVDNSIWDLSHVFDSNKIDFDQNLVLNSSQKSEILDLTETSNESDNYRLKINIENEKLQETPKLQKSKSFVQVQNTSTSTPHNFRRSRSFVEVGNFELEPLLRKTISQDSFLSQTDTDDSIVLISDEELNYSCSTPYRKPKSDISESNSSNYETPKSSKYSFNSEHSISTTNKDQNRIDINENRNSNSQNQLDSSEIQSPDEEKREKSPDFSKTVNSSIQNDILHQNSVYDNFYMEVDNCNLFNNENEENISKIPTEETRDTSLFGDSFDREIQLGLLERLGLKKSKNNAEIKKIPEEQEPISPSFETPKTEMIVKEHDVTPMPDYDLMDTPARNSELDKFGLKPLKRKRANALLRYIYEQTHPLVEQGRSLVEKNSGNEDDCVIKRRKKMETSKKNISPENISNSYNHPLPTSIEIVGSLISERDKESDLIFETKESKKIASCRLPFHIAWHNFVSSNEDIRLNILQYQPIQLEDIYAQFKEMGFKYNINDILTFLDRRCITIRTNQNTHRNNKKISKQK